MGNFQELQRADFIDTGLVPDIELKLRQILTSTPEPGVVCLDWDNTCINFDIQDAFFDQLSNQLPNAKRFFRALSRYHSVNEGVDAETHHKLTAEFYTESVELLEGLRPSDVYETTSRSFGAAQELGVGPTIRIEIAKVIALARQHGHRVCIVSASNVWSVRAMVLQSLNPLLEDIAAGTSIPPEDVFGVSNVLVDSLGLKHHDRELAISCSAYANCKSEMLNRFTLGRELSAPAPIYGGKAEVVKSQITEAPLLCAGDSANDMEMLALGQYKLWMARLDTPSKLAELVSDPRFHAKRERWLLQPVMLDPRFYGPIADYSSLVSLFGTGVPERYDQSWKIIFDS